MILYNTVQHCTAYHMFNNLHATTALVQLHDVMCCLSALHMPTHMGTCSHGICFDNISFGTCDMSTHAMLYATTLANECYLCRPQPSPSHPSSKPPTHPPLSEVLLKLLGNSMTPSGLLQRALECYSVVVAVTPALHRFAFAGIVTSGMTKLLVTAALTTFTC